MSVNARHAGLARYDHSISRPEIDRTSAQIQTARAVGGRNGDAGDRCRLRHGRRQDATITGRRRARLPAARWQLHRTCRLSRAGRAADRHQATCHQHAGADRQTGSLAERLAEEARLEAEAEAARAAVAAEEARRQKIIANTISGTDITYNPTMSVSDDDIWLMACIIDWEAAYQPYAGKLAVANVILNRVRSGHYPGTVSGVVYQRSQFSGVSDGAGNPSDRFAARLANGPRNTECMQAALEALSGVNNIGGYTSFRALYTVDVNNYSDFVIIGDHIFH